MEKNQFEVVQENYKNEDQIKEVTNSITLNTDGYTYLFSDLIEVNDNFCNNVLKAQEKKKKINELLFNNENVNKIKVEVEETSSNCSEIITDMNRVINISGIDDNLSNDFRYFLEIELNSNEMVELFSTGYIVKEKNRIKCTKYLKAIFQDRKKEMLERIEFYKKEMLENNNDLYEKRISRIHQRIEQINNVLSSWDKIAVLISQVLEKTKKDKNLIDVYISTDILDLLTISDNSIYTSCHTIQNYNCQKLGNIEYMYSDKVAVMYTLTSDRRKKSRALIYFNNDFSLVALGRVYGKDTENEFKKVLVNLLGLNISNKKSFSYNVNISDRFTSAHVDNVNFFTSLNGSSVENTRFVITTCYEGSIKCLCGSGYSVDEDFIGLSCNACCKDDNRYYCDYCNEYHHENYINEVNEEFLCDDCLRKHYQQCGECGEYHVTDNSYYSERYNNYLCESCYCENIANCENCDDEISVKHDRFFEVNVNNSSYILCDYCVQEK